MSGNLRTVVGVDEAGYGPLLGPLVVGLAAFRVPAGSGDVRSLLPGTADRAGPVPVDDSKVLYRGPGRLATLERTVLAFRTLCAEAEVPDPPRESPPWGLAHPPDLPVAAAEEEIEAARTALAADSEASGVLLLDLRTRTVGVEELNRGVVEHGTKAAVLFVAAMELVAPWLDEPGETEVFVDRHGGRSHYSPLLVERFAGRHHWIVGEDRKTSTYRFPDEGGDVTIAFEVGGDARHLPTALASMAAKYVRELHMRALNEHFNRADPELRPTAGYYEDARRWLSESASLRRRLEVDDDLLVRRR